MSRKEERKDVVSKARQEKFFLPTYSEYYFKKKENGKSGWQAFLIYYMLIAALRLRQWKNLKSLWQIFS